MSDIIINLPVGVTLPPGVALPPASDVLDSTTIPLGAASSFSPIDQATLSPTPNNIEISPSSVTVSTMQPQVNIPATVDNMNATIPSEVENTSSQVIDTIVPQLPIGVPFGYNASQIAVDVMLRKTAICPAGFICNGTHQASCEDIRRAAIEKLGFGDIHAGAYCPKGSPYYLICDVGFYCPNSVSSTEGIISI